MWLGLEIVVAGNGEMFRIKHFLNDKISSTYLIRLRFQGYRCKSGIVNFVRRVARN